MADDDAWRLTDGPSSAWQSAILRSGEPLLQDLLSAASDECGPPGYWESPIEHVMALAMCMLRRTRYRRFDMDFAGLTEPRTEDDARAMAERWLSRDRWPEIEDTWDGPICAETRQKVEKTESVLLGYIFPQVTIGGHRVDFLILHLEGLDGLGGVVIECDGYDYHERTKEQAARDRARDRELQASGYKVLRFMGSEIWRDAIGCADQALDTAAEIARGAELDRALRWYMGRDRYYEWVGKGIIAT